MPPVFLTRTLALDRYNPANLRRSSHSISLVLIGSTLAALGFQACDRRRSASDPPDSAYADGDFSATTQPSTGNPAAYGTHAHWVYTNGVWHDYSHGVSSLRGFGRSSAARGTSRGGFGSIGHAMGHGSGS